MKWLAPAKINLSLRVLGRRPDGFHELETLMVPLSLADELNVIPLPDKPAGTIELWCSDPSLPTGESNLAYRAAKLFYDRLEDVIRPAIRIELTKHIPHGAGLGGGSSDAATVLLALSDLCGAPFGIARLCNMAAELGSDVPFFVFKSAAICRGRGELVEPRAFSVALPILLAKPEFSIPTPWAYKRWQESRAQPGVSYAPQSFSWGELVNDLERPVYEKYLSLAEMKNWLLDQPEVAGAILSGSGSTMIAVLQRQDTDVDLLTTRLQARFGTLWTHPCTVMPTLSEAHAPT